MEHNERIGHEGVVQKVTKQSVTVLITSRSACAGCHAKSACGLSESADKLVEVREEGNRFQPGERVTVYATKGNALYAVLFAYVIPSLLLAGTIWAMGAAGSREVIAAVASLSVLTLYYIVLYLNREKMGKKIRFTVEKQNIQSNSL
ncbi:MAG: SoxR reducing system RseC family protein [Culturomica sp.]|jgi:sigma-E factor negative regulatory protein RseC|nr:SoxR reducing system RseC family protein [Culturomica sp.]